MSTQNLIRRIVAEGGADRTWDSSQMLTALRAAGWTTACGKPRNAVTAAMMRLYDLVELDRPEQGIYVAVPQSPPDPGVGEQPLDARIKAASVPARGQYEPVQIYAPTSEEPVPLAAPSTMCAAWGGRSDWFQYEARITNGVINRHVWIVTTCKTPMCMIHIKTLRPVRVDYLPDVCVYCGFWAETKDHLVPRGWSGDVDRSWVFTVPACRECNLGIGSKWAPTITERRSVAHKFIRRKYRRHLAQDRFTQEDLDEMGRNLRSLIESGMQVGELTRKRLAWPPFEGYDIQAAQRSGIDDPYAIGLIK